MRINITSLIPFVFLCLIPFQGFADDGNDSQEPEREPAYLDRIATVYSFLDQNVLGKVLRGGLVGQTIDQKNDFEFLLTSLISNSRMSDSGLEFFDTTTTNTTLFPLIDGQRSGDTTQRKSYLVSQCELSEKEVSGEMIGFCRIVVNKDEDTAGELFFLRVAEVSEKKLVLEEQQIGYSDFTNAEQKLIAISTHTKRTFVVDNQGELAVEVQLTIDEVTPNDATEMRPYSRQQIRQETFTLYEVKQ